jgi:hypothetical protein
VGTMGTACSYAGLRAIEKWGQGGDRWGQIALLPAFVPNVPSLIMKAGTR